MPIPLLTEMRHTPRGQALQEILGREMSGHAFPPGVDSDDARLRKRCVGLLAFSFCSLPRFENSRNVEMRGDNIEPLTGGWLLTKTVNGFALSPFARRGARTSSI